MAEREQCKLQARRCARLIDHFGQVVLDGLRTDIEANRDVAVTVSCCQTSMPPIRGIAASNGRTSGLVSRGTRMASTPSAASATTLNPVRSRAVA